MDLTDTANDLAARIAEMSPQRRALLELLARQRRTEQAPIPKSRSRGESPPSFAQQRLWFLDQHDPGSPGYNIHEVERVRGALDVARLDRALARLCQRHDVLRSVYPLRDGRIVQVVTDNVPRLDVVDLRGVPSADREQAASRYVAEEIRRPFDLAAGPLLRAVVVSLADDYHYLVLTTHHIVTDGWSTGLMVKELTALYADRADTLPPLPIQYADFAAWQRERLSGPLLSELLDHWRAELAGANPLLELPGDRPRPARRSSRGDQVRFHLDADLIERLNELAHEAGATLFMALLAGFDVVMARYSGQNDVCVGTPVAGRTRPETEPLVGLFVNSVVLRTDLSGDPSFRQVLQRVRDVTLRAYEHQELPFERLVEDLRPSRDAGHTPLFQVMIVMQNAPSAPPSGRGLVFEPVSVHNGAAKFDLTVDLFTGPQGVTGSIEYATDLFDEATVARLAAHLGTVLRAAVDDPDRSVHRLELLTPDERRELLAGWNDTARDWATSTSVPAQVAEQAARSPEAVAVQFGDITVSYRDLDRRANGLAHRLRRAGVGPDGVVGVCLERSVDLVVALLAVLRAGGAFLPVEPEYPPDRQTLLLREAGAVALVTGAGPAGFRGDPGRTPVLGPQPSATDEHEPPTGAPYPGNLAYVLYTSGSTGVPKAVMSTHEGLRNRLLWMQSAYRLGPDDRVLQKTPFSFDVSVWEFFWPLITGARLVVAPPGDHRRPDRLVDLVVRHGVTTMHFVPSMLRAFLDEPRVGECRGIRTLIASGEALPTGLARDAADRLPAAALHNLYGPTEASIDVSAFPARDGLDSDGPTVPIGHPIANTVLRVLDDHLGLVPVGVPGELYIGGVGLARGYLGRPDLTAERFVPDPFAATPGARLYRTGDRVRYRPGGGIEYLDRVDRQLKIRGLRIEPGEVEGALRAYPEVTAAAVMAWPGTEGRPPRLAGYVVPPPDTTLSVADLLAFLRGRLPEHLVPAFVIPMSALPTTVNGKVDYRALPPPGDERPEIGEYARPTTDDEELLANLWAGVLGLDQVGIDDNFFALGGDSIRGIEVVARAQQRGFDLTLADLFAHQNVRALSAARRRGLVGGTVPEPSHEPFALIDEADRRLLPAGLVDAYPLSALQAGMILEHERSGDSSIYHDVFSFHVRGTFDPDSLVAAATRLVAAHPVLRTSIHVGGYREPLQFVHATGQVPVTVEDLRGLPATRQEETIARWLVDERTRGFRWDRPTHLRLHVHRRGDDTFQATMSCSNVVLDGWSVASMLTELFRTYASVIAGSAPPPVETPSDAFRRFVELERHATRSAPHREYWDGVLGQVTSVPLPGRSAPVGEAPTRRIRHVHPVPIAGEVDGGLRRLARLAGVPLKSVLLAAHLFVVRALGGPVTPATGLVVNGRPEEAGAVQALGLFLNVVPMAATRPDGDWVAAAQAAFDAERGLLPYRHYPAALMRAGRDGALRLETAFNFVQFHVYQLLDGIEGLEVLGGDLFDDTNFPLWTEFSVDPRTDRIRLELSYDSATLPEERVAAFGGYYAAVLAAMSDDPRADTRTLRLLDEAQYATLVRGWNATEVPVPESWSVTRLFEEQVASTPDATAFFDEADRLTFAELNRRANRLAHYLRETGVTRGTPVGVCLERSLEVPATLLAIFKAGAVYVPLDPAYPAERLAAAVRGARVAVVVTTSEQRGALSTVRARMVLLDRIADELAERPDTDPGSVTAPDDLAYVIFTSGSTGRPKGVAVEHRQILNRLAWMWQEYPFAPDSVSAQKTSLNFVDSLWELLGPALRGSPTAVIPDRALRDPHELVRVLAVHRVTRLWLVPSLLRTLLVAYDDLARRLPDLRFWVTSGEALPGDLWRLFHERLPGGKLYNLYGTSEVWDATWFDPDRGGVVADSVPIGRPLWNVRAYVLDDLMRPVPAGVVGELYVGGAGLARGYLNDPDLTAARFVPDPFSAEPGARLYRSGDLVALAPGGDLHFVGRADQQLKVRGFRVEPGEVEAALRRHPAVRAAVVVGYGQPEPKLAAYVVAPPEALDEVRAFARGVLPAHLVPSRYLPLPELPLTPSGKVDRRALPRVEPEAAVAGDLAPPTTPSEKALCALWAEVLGRPAIGVRDNFFDIGGDSLLAMVAVARIRRAFGVTLPVTTVFAAPTVAELAELLPGPGRPTDEAKLVPRAREEWEPVSYAQRRMWFTTQLDPDSAAYNVALGVRLSGPLDVDALGWSLRELVRRHEVLRTTYELRDGEPVQRLHEWLEPELIERDGTGENAEEPLPAMVAAEVRRPFDLAAGPVVRALLVTLGAREHLAVVTVHHIACDAWSMETLSAELTELYRGRVSGAPAPAAPEVQYADYAHWQRELLAPEPREALIEHWRQYLAGAPAVIDLSGGRVRPGPRSHRGATTELLLAPELAGAVRRMSVQAGATLFMALLAGYGTVLRHQVGVDDLVIGTDVAGRDDPALERLIGFFVNQLPLRLGLAGNPTFAELLERARVSTLDAYAHWQLPFDHLVEALAPARNDAHPPVFQVKLVLQNVPEQPLDLPGVTATPFPVDRGTAQMDLNLRAAQTPAGLVLSAEHDVDVLPVPTAQLLLNQLRAVLERAVADPGVRLDELEAQLAAEAQAHRARASAQASAAATDRLRQIRRRRAENS